MKIAIKSEYFNKFLGFVDRNLSSPGQRLILGVTALASQPFIDFYNKNVDKETRTTSALRITSKIIVGTTTGVLIRALCIKIAGKNKMFLHPAIKNIDSPQAKRYINTMGTLLGTFTSLFTNFLIDAPLTKLLTNHLCAKVKKESKNEKIV